MGAVFAMFSAWYFWVPKLLGLSYDIYSSKIQFWVLFIGVKGLPIAQWNYNFYVGGAKIWGIGEADKKGKRFNLQLTPGSSSATYDKITINWEWQRVSRLPPLGRVIYYIPSPSSIDQVDRRRLGCTMVNNFPKIGNRLLLSSTQFADKCRYYSTVPKRLDPWWISGFVDGEGSFSVFMYKSSKLKVGWETQLAFNITLHSKDLNLLIRIQSFFGVGFIKNYKAYNRVSYNVVKFKDLVRVIIPHFNKYFLITKKRADFNLFSSVAEMVKNKEHLNEKGLVKILSYKASINRGISKLLLDNFKDIVPVERPMYEVTEIPSPNWVAGFASAEGCFHAVLFKRDKYKTGYMVQLRFIISQHTRDQLVMEKIAEFFRCGYVNYSSIKQGAAYTVTDIKSTVNVIIPFFNTYLIEGCKSLDFADFCKIAYIIRDKAHLTEEGIIKIKELASKMNLKRKHDLL